MSRSSRVLLGLVLATTLAAGAPQAAGADIAAPVIVPAPDSTGIPNSVFTPACTPLPGYTQTDGPNPWRTCLLPSRDAVVDWPNPTNPGVADPMFWPGPRSFILPAPGLYAIWLGETRSEEGRPLIWYDVGSGRPVAPVSGPWQFPLSGKYAWECLVCGGQERIKLQGTMYVLGPRAIVSHKLISSDNSGSSVTYGFDASGSFVTDYTAHSIVEYAFDYQDDGTFEQTSPEPTGSATYPPGPHTIRVRVTDDIGRVAEFPYFFEIPYVRAGNPEPNVVTDTSLGNINSGVKFPKSKVKVTAAKKIKVKVLRSRGLSIKVTGLNKGDRVKARLLKGKKALVASGTGTATSAKKSVRLRVGRAGKRILKAKPRVKRLVLDVNVEGTDGFAVTKRVAVRVS